MTTLVSAEKSGQNTEQTIDLYWLNNLNISLKDTKITQKHPLKQGSNKSSSKFYQGSKMHTHSLSGAILFSLNSSCGKSHSVMALVQKKKKKMEFYKFIYFYLFIFGCVGSLLLCTGFL